MIYKKVCKKCGNEFKTDNARFNYCDCVGVTREERTINIRKIISDKRREKRGEEALQRPKTKKVICIDCRSEFELLVYGRKTERCVPCRKKHAIMKKAESRKKYVNNKEKNKVEISFDEVMKAAKEKGLTYGKYVSQYL